MKKITIISVVLLVILSLFAILYFSDWNITGKTIEANYYSYTRAICNEKNFCQDYGITCHGKEIVSFSPITGVFAQFSEDWIDPRRENEKEIFCNR